MNEEDEEGDQTGVESVRDFCLVSPDGVADPHYRVGVLRFISEDDHSENSVQIIFVSVVDNKVLCAVPGFAWHRLVKERVLPSGALIRATSVAVASVPEEDREKVESDCPYIRVWLGFLKPSLEDQVSFQNVEDVPPQFVTDDLGGDRIPDAQALFVVADEKYAFVSAESENQQKAGGDSVVETRLNRLEEMLLSLREELRGTPAKAAGAGLAAKPKTVPSAKPSANQAKAAGKSPVAGLEGLDPHVVRSALQAGVEQDQLAQLARMTGHTGPGRLRDTPGPVLPKKLDILGESEEEMAGDGEPVAAVESKDAMTQAVLKLTSIVDALGAGRKKHRSLEELLDSSPAGREGDSSSLSFGSSRKHATILKALKKALIESPHELYASLERRMREDFGSRVQGPGEPLQSGSYRGWLEHRSRVPNIPGTVRLGWGIAGALDCLCQEPPRISECKARLALLLAQIDQVAVDRGSWLLAAEGSLEDPPPFSSFSRHSPPEFNEAQHTRLWDGRWAEALMNRVKETDDFVERRQKLGRRGTRNQVEELAEVTKNDAAPKKKGKGRGAGGGRKGEDPPKTEQA